MKGQLKSINFKFILFFVIFVAAIFSIIVMTSVQQTRQITSTMVEIVGMPILNRVSYRIDGDRFERLARTLDANDPFYIETQRVFRQLRNESQVFFLYAMAPYDGDIHIFIFDGEDPDSEFFSALGEKEDITDYDEALMLVYETGEPQFVPIVHYSDWGHLVSAYMPIFNSSGDVVGIIGVDFDGSSIHNATASSIRIYVIFAVVFIVIGFFIYSFLLKDIISQNKNLEIASNAKSEFLATMSHEIRTPLNAIIGITQIQMQEDLPKEHAAALEKIGNSGNVLLRIINDILDMSKIETGKLALNPVKYDTPSLIGDTVQLNIVRIGSKPIKFLLDVDENLPGYLYGDDLRVKQILNNLLSNAIKYTEFGHVKLSVSQKPEGESVLLRFDVEDTGQGMKTEDKEQLFSKYLRFNTRANRNSEGTGLGLTITKKLVDMMGGTIRVESEYGKGSTFTVTVRQKTEGSPPIGAELAGELGKFTFLDERYNAKLQISREPMPYGKVLVVDDVETNLYVAEGLLSPYKLNVETADSGFAVLEKINGGKKYDIIFMDHMMPLMDGMETTQKLRAMGYDGPIVALTANALVGNDEIFLQNGFDGFIAKPIDIRRLNHTLNNFIRDRYPEEAEKYIPEVSVESTEVSPRIKKIFVSDAQKAIATLRETIAKADLPLFTITAHAMKSALANVNELDASKLAGALERAGERKDGDFIVGNTETFIKILENIIEAFKPTEPERSDEGEIEEDTGYLKGQLESIIAACEEYHIQAAYDALDRLDEKPWRPETLETIERIRDELQLNSGFDEAAAIAGGFVKKM
ncbi:MAG: ATP-binding protein [Defluviitaleaceae bacterium]|nr:ATP-binding protein [Defluviitaleaceae bacterium]